MTGQPEVKTSAPIDDDSTGAENEPLQPHDSTNGANLLDLVGADTLRWVEKAGGRFCRVFPWDMEITDENKEWFHGPGKQPMGAGWQDRPFTFAQVEPHLTAGGNVGMIAGAHSNGLVLLDCDEQYSLFCDLFSWARTAPAFVRMGGDKGKVLVKVIGDIPKAKKFKRSPKDTHPFFEYLATGNQGVIAGTHPSGQPYRLIHSDQAIPEFTGKELSEYCEIWTGKGLGDDQPKPAPTAQQWATYKPQEPKEHKNGDGLREAVRVRWSPYEVFKHFGMGSRTHLEGQELRLLGNGGLFVHCENGQPGNTWAIPGENIGGGPFEAWQYCKTGSVNVPKDGTFYELLKEMANEGGIPIPAPIRQAPTLQPPEPPQQDLNDLQSPPAVPGQGITFQAAPLVLLTEVGNGRLFADKCAAKVRFCGAFGWLVWDGKRWALDETGEVRELAKGLSDFLFYEACDLLDLAKQLGEKAKQEADPDQQKKLMDQFTADLKEANRRMAWALQSQTDQKVNATLKQAASIPGIATRATDFDADPWLLNVQNGVIDLRTGYLLPHDPGRLIRKLVPIDYDPQAECPTWDKFLSYVFSNVLILAEYVRLIVGYSLTGDTREQCFFFLHGSGRNGKSTFLNVLAWIMGDYFKRAAAATLMLNKFGGRGPTEGLANLAGARLVAASELAAGMEFDESILKDLTGEDPITARNLYQREFTYRAALKLWLAGNEKPKISGTDLGIWRRVRLIPFTRTIPENEVDKKLPAKLKAELPGILAWAVRGCLEWQQSGLTTPAVVTLATEEYREAEDTIGRFIGEMCVQTPNAVVTISELHAAYTKWGGSETLKVLSKEMEKRGFTRKHTMNGTVISGLGLMVVP